MIRLAIKKITNSVKLLLFKRSWRKKNIHNNTTVKNLFPIDKVLVGKKTYGPIFVKTYGNPNEKLTIGSYCSIAGDVKFLLGGEHSYTGLSTFPFKKYVCGLNEDTLTKGQIILQDDVWIGERSLILSGVTIGQGAIVAAGSVVAKDIPPYAIYAGGKVIKYRFPEDVIKRLLKFNYSSLSDELIIENIDTLYKELNIDMLNNSFIKDLL
ncbi:CatB-related O-acetyltransferase [Litchfieldia salsa]|uniref:Acetyltransferase (Isoleucine patch superfamily) n=1 Tax=Litchfieldia salsa TaxID=930152 RepID=A0A1H0W6G3_9BACI|nr:CatB-related O-acetyltransferase [Litchfieldia salsa]SDP86334.1 Acetyltransferase (isoleucine patch superfamily) [Litchfieldia salsa]